MPYLKDWIRSFCPTVLESFLNWTNTALRQNPLVAVYVDKVEAFDGCDTVGQKHTSVTLSLPAHQISTRDSESDEVRPLRLDGLPCRLFLRDRQQAGQYRLVNNDILIPDSAFQGLEPSYKGLECRVKSQDFNGNFNLARPEIIATGWDNAFFPVRATPSLTIPPASRLLRASPGSGGLPAALSQPRSTSGPHRKLINTKIPDGGLSPGHEGNRPTFIEDANRGPLGPLRTSKHIKPTFNTLGYGHSFLNLRGSASSLWPFIARGETTVTDFGGPLGPLPNLQDSPQTTPMESNRIFRKQSTAAGFASLRDSLRRTDDVVRAQITAMSNINDNPSFSGFVAFNGVPAFRPTSKYGPLLVKVSGPISSNTNVQRETPQSPAAARNSLIITGSPLTALGVAGGEDLNANAPSTKSPLQQSSASKDSNDPNQIAPGNPATHRSPPTVGQRATGLPLAVLPVTLGGQSQELVPISLSEQMRSETPSKNGQRASRLSIPALRSIPEELPNPTSAAFPAVTVGGQSKSLVPVKLPGTVADQVAPQAGQSDTIPIAQGSGSANPLPNQSSDISPFPETTVGGQREQLVPVRSSKTGQSDTIPIAESSGTANPIPNQSSDMSAFPEITVGGQREQLVPVRSSKADVGSHTIVAGSVPILVAGKPVSLGQSTLAVGSSPVPLPVLFSDSAPQSQARIGGTAIALNPTAIPIAGTILSLGGPAVTVDNTPVSLGRMGLALGSSTLPIPKKGPNPVLALGSETVFPGDPSNTPVKGWRAQSTVAGNPQNMNPLQFSIAGTRLSQGGPGFTLSGTPISLGSSGLVVGEATLPIAAASQANQSPLIVAGQVFTPNPTGFSIADTALSRGGPGVTLSGTPVSLGPSGLVVGKTTLPLAAELRAAQAPLTVGGQIFTPNPLAFPIAGTTLSLGGPGITISQTPVSLGASGLLIGSSTLPMDISNSASLANTPSVVSIAGNVITRGGPPVTISSTRVSLGASGLVVGTKIVPLSAFDIPSATSTPPSGAIYSIGGTRITQGGPAITISGTRVSLGTKALVIGSSTIPLPSHDMINETFARTSRDLASTLGTRRSFESSVLSPSASAMPTEPSASSLGRPIPPVVDNHRAGTGRMRPRRGLLCGLFAFLVFLCTT